MDSTICRQQDLGAGFSYPSRQLGLARPIVQGKIPTSVLTSCKQIHDESRLIPFHKNTFAFVNWFWSGVYASRQFTRGLQTWQSEALRWSSVEVLGRDLWVGALSAGPGTGEDVVKGEWWDLCSMWRGVWGLRMAIKGSTTQRADGWSSVLSTLAASEEAPKDKSLLNTELGWVQDGLLCLKQLRWIEIEIEDVSVDRDRKLKFCQDLGKLMGEVKVVLVERVRVEVPEKEFKWFGGAPSDQV